MNLYVVVTDARGAEVVEAAKVIESPATLLFYVGGKERKEFAKRDVLVWRKCETPAEAVAFIAENGL